MKRPKLSEEERKKRRQESYRKSNEKRKIKDIFILSDEHPNANLATSEQHTKELEDRTVVPRIESTVEHTIDHNPDEDFSGLGVGDNEVNDDQFYNEGPDIKSVEGHSTSTVYHSPPPSLTIPPRNPPSKGHFLLIDINLLADQVDFFLTLLQSFISLHEDYDDSRRLRSS